MSEIVKTVNLCEIPRLKINVDGKAMEFSLSRVDISDGYLKNQRMIQTILENAQGLHTGTKTVEGLIDDLRLWIQFAIGKEGYDEIFRTAERRRNYPWHERIFIAGYTAIAAARAGLIDAAADSPLIRQLKNQVLEKTPE